MIPKALAEGLELVEVDASVADDAILELTSLQVVMLVEHLESELQILFDGNDVTRENFSTKKALVALLAKKGITS